MKIPPDIYSPKLEVSPILNVYGPFTEIFRGSQPFNSSMPWTSEKVTKSPSSKPCRVSSKQVTTPSLSYFLVNMHIPKIVSMFLYLVDRSNHPAKGLFAGWIDTRELRTKVIEYRSEPNALSMRRLAVKHRILTRKDLGSPPR